jgi:hypothetical protein
MDPRWLDLTTTLLAAAWVLGLAGVGILALPWSDEEFDQVLAAARTLRRRYGASLRLGAAPPAMRSVPLRRVHGARARLARIVTRPRVRPLTARPPIPLRRFEPLGMCQLAPPP